MKSIKDLTEELPRNLRGSFQATCLELERQLDSGRVKRKDAIKNALFKRASEEKLNISKTPGMVDYLDALNQYAESYIQENLHSEPTGIVKDEEILPDWISSRSLSREMVTDTGNSQNYAVSKGYFSLDGLEKGSIGNRILGYSTGIEALY
jgi:hypothetical protein